MKKKFKDISIDSRNGFPEKILEFKSACAEKNLQLWDSHFLDTEVERRLGSDFVLFLSREVSMGGIFHHYIFITKTEWDPENSNHFCQFIIELIAASARVGVHAKFYLYSPNAPCEDVARYASSLNIINIFSRTKK